MWFYPVLLSRADTMTRKSNGYVLYEGPSKIDGSPIAVIVTGTARKSDNVKTADMLQTWIIRTDIEPHEAKRTGADSAI